MLSVIALNKEQQKAVETTEGPLLIVAGAGAGKTKTLTERIVHIIKKGVEPEKILAITFTNKAAQEMRARIIARLEEEKLIENGSRTPVIKTFHSFGAFLLREHSQLFGLTRHSPILDEGDALAIVKNVCEQLGLNIDPKRMLHAISRAKGDAVRPEEYGAQAQGPFQKTVAQVWLRYEDDLRKNKSLDFDDLILRPLRMLQENETFRNYYQNHFQYIHVDEYQDTNETQYQLTKILASKHKNICVVGDSDQNIYSWRGANLKNILNFENDFPNTTIVLLEQNYRSTKTVLDAANAVIGKNKARTPKVLRTDSEEGELITIIRNWDEGVEARWIAEKCAALIADGAEPKEIAVLFRTNFQSRALEQGFMESNIPYRMIGVRFFDRKEVRDIVSYIRVALVRESGADFRRAATTPSRGLGKVTITKVLSGKVTEENADKKLKPFFNLLNSIKTYTEEHTVAETISYVMKETGYEKMLKEEGTDESLERLANIQELVSFATRYNEEPGLSGMEHFFEEVSLLTDKETAEENAVRLMTVHASKGLEIEYVFITGLEHGLFPSERGAHTSQTIEEMEEERRLFYVALTRAKKKLFLSHAELRMIFGSKQINVPSEFLEDIPEHLVEHTVADNEGNGKVIVYL